jgi:hypothetical protein
MGRNANESIDRIVQISSHWTKQLGDQTHYPECWEHHPACAISLIADIGI